MNELDYAIAVLMVISIAVGVVRGAIREVINVAGWIIAFMLARAFAPDISGYFADWMTEPAYRVALAWMAIFLAVLVMAGLLASLLSELVRKLGLSGLDRTLGAMIGVLRGGLAILLLTLVAGMTKVPQTVLWKNAASTPWLETVAMHARGVLPENLAARISFRLPRPPQVAT